MTFDHDLFHILATQLRTFADDYAALGITAEQAASWANQGFTPGEAACQMGRCAGHGYPTTKAAR